MPCSFPYPFPFSPFLFLYTTAHLYLPPFRTGLLHALPACYFILLLLPSPTLPMPFFQFLLPPPHLCLPSLFFTATHTHHCIPCPFYGSLPACRFCRQMTSGNRTPNGSGGGGAEVDRVEWWAGKPQGRHGGSFGGWGREPLPPAPASLPPLYHLPLLPIPFLFPSIPLYSLPPPHPLPHTAALSPVYLLTKTSSSPNIHITILPFCLLMPPSPPPPLGHV